MAPLLRLSIGCWLRAVPSGLDCDGSAPLAPEALPIRVLAANLEAVRGAWCQVLEGVADLFTHIGFSLTGRKKQGLF